MTQQSPARPATYLVLALLLALAAWLRVVGIGFGLPYLYQPDEPSKVLAAVNIVRTGDLNPHYFAKPTLLIYANAMLYLPYLAWGRMTGRLTGAQELAPPERLVMGVGHIATPEVVLLGRLLSAAIGVSVVLLTYLVGLRFLRDRAAALFGALIVAVSFQQVVQSHYIEVNVFLTAALLGVAWASLRLYERGDRRSYLLAGFLVGIATTCKYPGVTGIVFPATAHWLRSGRKLVLSREAKLALLMVPVGFFLGTPYALLDPLDFVTGAGYEAYHYSTGHEGLEGNAPLWYLGYALTREGPLALLGLVAGVAALFRPAGRRFLLASFPVAYYLFISVFKVRNGRTFMPLTPFAFLLAAELVVAWARRLRDPAFRLPVRALGAVAVIGFAGFGIGVPLANSLGFNRRLQTVDSRETARVWIEQNLPAGSKIAIEAFAPWVSPERYQVEGVRRTVEFPAEWYAAKGIRYIVFSEGMYGRYFRDPGRYRERVAQYEALWRRFPLVRRFQDGGFEIRIHEVR